MIGKPGQLDCAYKRIKNPQREPGGKARSVGSSSYLGKHPDTTIMDFFSSNKAF